MMSHNQHLFFRILLGLHVGFKVQTEQLKKNICDASVQQCSKDTIFLTPILATFLCINTQQTQFRCQPLNGLLASSAACGQIKCLPSVSISLSLAHSLLSFLSLLFAPCFPFPFSPSPNRCYRGNHFSALIQCGENCITHTHHIHSVTAFPSQG